MLSSTTIGDAARFGFALNILSLALFLFARWCRQNRYSTLSVLIERVCDVAKRLWALQTAVLFLDGLDPSVKLVVGWGLMFDFFSLEEGGRITSPALILARFLTNGVHHLTLHPLIAFSGVERLAYAICWCVHCYPWFSMLTTNSRKWIAFLANAGNASPLLVVAAFAFGLGSPPRLLDADGSFSPRVLALVHMLLFRTVYNNLKFDLPAKLGLCSSSQGEWLKPVANALNQGFAAAVLLFWMFSP